MQAVRQAELLKVQSFWVYTILNSKITLPEAKNIAIFAHYQDAKKKHRTSSAKSNQYFIENLTYTCIVRNNNLHFNDNIQRPIKTHHASFSFL